MVHAKQLIKTIDEEYRQLYSTIRRFGSFYNNTSVQAFNAGEYKVGDTSILVRENNTAVKDLAGGLDKLNDRLKTCAPDSVWSISVLENPSTFGIFHPMRPGYQDLFKSYAMHENLKSLIEREHLGNIYQEFYGCTTRITEVYEEAVTKQKVRTIYFPIHNRKSLDAIVAVDIKATHTNNIVDKYNANHHTTLNLNGENNIYDEPATLPCSNDGPVNIGFHYLDVLKHALWPSFISAILLHLGYRLMCRRGRSIKNDEMTGLFRRDYYEPKFRRMNNFSMLVIDIDHFKQINDTHGHIKGDEVLTACAQIILAQIRAEDVAVRWGGEEFVVMFKDMQRGAMFDKAEQIRQSISARYIANLPVTVSIGGHSAMNTTFSKAYKAADAALYQSKHRGRNKVTLA
ncbi:sensory box/GGDEF family protein [Grimontia indica]|uniref:diguanylate cyclase n=1 Tax=Grimontia indica TaxID=1056512 RepID=R1GQ68_9GAMM|nr:MULTISPECIES: GGDEF domain-containing protein [Grimontia]EOD78368.1 sensory box/GGDEF family protein [Grimontia indica]